MEGGRHLLSRRLLGMALVASAATAIGAPAARADSHPLTYRLGPAWARAG